MSAELSLGVRKRGQRQFLWFTLFNVISFNFLSGNIITLYALRLGADSLLVGLLAAFVSVAELMPPLGKILVGRFGAVRVMGIAWFARYLSMVPLVAAPLLARQGGGNALALGLCILCTLGFHVTRGLGITSHNPIIGAITSPRDRGSFLSRNQLIIHVLSIATGVAMALLLQLRTDTTGLVRYSIILGIGVLAGLVASTLLLGLPEPPEGRRASSTPLLSSVRRGLGRSGFRRFLVVHFLSFLFLTMAGPFLIVFLKRGHAQSDDIVVIFTVIGSVGSIVTALFAGVVLDRFGAKPFYFIFMVLVAVALVFPVLSPTFHSAAPLWVFAGVLFFVYGVGSVGVNTSVNTYFFSLIDPHERLNLGIVYFVVTGLGGTLGSLAGGILLQLLQDTPGLGNVSHGLPAFRVYYGALAGGLVLLLPAILGLEKQGSRDVREVLSNILSLRDLRTIVLLGRLARTGDVADERRVIHALGESSSEESSDEIIDRLGSPMFAIRLEALGALRNLPLDAAAEAALVAEVRNHHFTTAYVAAEIIGNRKLAGASPELRDALRSGDYMLQASAMIALAQLGDREGVAAVRALVGRTDNPRLVIYGAQALEIAGDLESLKTLLGRLRARPYPYVRDEIILCAAGILGVKRLFYGWYRQFLERSLLGLTAVRDYMQERILRGERSAVPPEVLTLGLEESTGRGQGFPAAVEESLRSLPIPVRGRDAAPFLRASVRDGALVRLERYRFLVASTLVWLSFENSRNLDGRRTP